jgi:hypothetical protein
MNYRVTPTPLGLPLGHTATLYPHPPPDVQDGISKGDGDFSNGWTATQPYKLYRANEPNFFGNTGEPGPLARSGGVAAAGCRPPSEEGLGVLWQQIQLPRSAPCPCPFAFSDRFTVRGCGRGRCRSPDGFLHLALFVCRGHLRKDVRRMERHCLQHDWQRAHHLRAME